MGWSATGSRVLLGADESEERREFPIYAWVGEKDEDGEPIEGEGHYEVSSVSEKKRTVTLERAEWRGLNQAGAEGKTATSGWRITGRNRVGESGQWTVTEEITTYGEWDIV
jgi:hypothetical protein